MKNLYLLMLLGMLSIISGHSAEKIYGHQSYGKETVNSIYADGSLLLEGTKILGLVQANGSLEADEAAIHNLQVNGKVNLKSCLISNGSIINGSLTANDTNFQNGLTVASQKITLRACSIDSLTVREIAGFEGVQVIDLCSGTKVTGPIVFESEKGEVWLSSNSEALGQITGAKVYKK